MISRHRIKQGIAGLLLVSVPVIWVPPLLEDGADSRPPASSADDVRPPLDGAVPPPGDPAAAAAERPARGAGSPPAALDSLGDMLRMLRGGAPSAPERPGGAEIPSRPVAPSGEVASAAVSDGRIDLFLDRHPLRGTLVGPSGATRALLGSRVVGVGDVLLDGVVRIDDVRTDSVLLSVAGAPRELFLPPFEVRARSGVPAGGAPAGRAPAEGDPASPAEDLR